MKRYVPFIIVLLVGLLALGAGAMLYRAKRSAAVTPTQDQPAAQDESKSLHVRGRLDAPVTLEEFGDFQCPPCGALAGPLHDIEKEYRLKLRVIFRNFPFEKIHQHARAAAYAAEAAGLQGKFWEMHDLLYREQAVWSKAPDVRELFESYARLLGLNVDRFRSDINSPAVQNRVAADQKRGSDLGVKNTPTIFINNRQVPPSSLNPGALREAINEALKETPSR